MLVGQKTSWWEHRLLIISLGFIVHVARSLTPQFPPKQYLIYDIQAQTPTSSAPAPSVSSSTRAKANRTGSKPSNPSSAPRRPPSQMQSSPIGTMITKAASRTSDSSRPRRKSTRTRRAKTSSNSQMDKHFTSKALRSMRFSHPGMRRITWRCI